MSSNIRNCPIIHPILYPCAPEQLLLLRHLVLVTHEVECVDEALLRVDSVRGGAHRVIVLGQLLPQLPQAVHVKPGGEKSKKIDATLSKSQEEKLPGYEPECEGGVDVEARGGEDVVGPALVAVVGGGRLVPAGHAAEGDAGAVAAGDH